MLPATTWIRLVAWLLIGLTIFFTYARDHTTDRFAALEREAEGSAGSQPRVSGGRQIGGNPTPRRDP